MLSKFRNFSFTICELLGEVYSDIMNTIKRLLFDLWLGFCVVIKGEK